MQTEITGSIVDDRTSTAGSEDQDLEDEVMMM
jgi:hypothetical protein